MPKDLRPEAAVWVWRHESGRHNFGDSLFINIVEALLGRQIAFKGESLKRRVLFPGGSVLHRCLENDVLWGVGLNNPKFHFLKMFPRRIDIRGVRGPLTASFVQHSLGRKPPPVVGDPGLLVGELFPDLGGAISQEHPVGVIHHFNDAVASRRDDVFYIDPLRDPIEVLPDIRKCELIVSSSLHGIIVAESYGIPARWLKTNSVPHFKYLDYYLSTGRSPEPCESVDEGIQMGGDAAIVDFDITALKNSFPRDCFESAAASGAGT